MKLASAVKEVEASIIKFNQSLPDQNLYQPVAYIMSLGGKRLRPALAIMANQLFGGKLEDIIHPALGVEVFHNFSLVHDDIMDNAPIRRGKPTVHEKWNANGAILSGDAMLVQSYQLIQKSNPSHIGELFSVFSKTALEVCEGQQSDMDFETRNDVSIPEYLEMIKLKTSVLIAGALELGAISAGASKQNREHIYNYGLNMGLAFQLRDDYLDAFGDSQKVGKQKGGDIIANKKTYLAIKALNLADLETTIELRKLQQETDIEHKVHRTLEIFKTLKVDTVTEELSQSYFKKAMNHLDQIKGSTEETNELKAFSSALMGREF